MTLINSTLKTPPLPEGAVYLRAVQQTPRPLIPLLHPCSCLPESCAFAAFHSSAGLKGMWGAVWWTTVKVDIQKW